MTLLEKLLRDRLRRERKNLHRRSGYGLIEARAIIQALQTVLLEAGIDPEAPAEKIARISGEGGER